MDACRATGATLASHPKRNIVVRRSSRVRLAVGPPFKQEKVQVRVPGPGLEGSCVASVAKPAGSPGTCGLRPGRRGGHYLGIRGKVFCRIGLGICT